jgi:hypothetical protein
MTAALIAGECLRKKLVPSAAIRWVLAKRTIVLDARHEFGFLGWTESLARWHWRFSNRYTALNRKSHWRSAKLQMLAKVSSTKTQSLDL